VHQGETDLFADGTQEYPYNLNPKSFIKRGSAPNAGPNSQ